jgi:16S rRNA (guanine(1405)-N(7))-methyltransferase
MADDRAESQLVEALAASRKYARVCRDTLWRTAAWALARHPSVREATKAAKRKLHQACGAYLDQLDARRLVALTTDLPSDPPALGIRCREVLACHASTAERLPFVEALYPALFAFTGVPSSVADLACGLHPFGLPWMGLPPGVRYTACDIDGRLVEAVGILLRHLGVDGAAECRDVLASPPEAAVDVVFLLKTAPCLEQQGKGAVLRVLRAVRARHIVLSYPAQSLGGREKGMREHYDEQARGSAEALRAEMQRVDFGTETFYVLALE